MNKNRLVLGLFGMALAAAFFTNAQDYPEAAAQMPLIYSVTVGLLSLAIVCSELLRWRATRQAEALPPEPVDEVTAPPRYAVTALVFVLAIAYVAAITTLGYVLSTVLFMAVALLLIRTVSVRFAVIGTVVLVAVVCLVFVQFLGLPIPLLPSALA
ncbi:tripartite tricarboxylate transporter TctB family protein [Stutzerimonas sp. VN223-3]|uniref:tripartite tricarboxylate transporter TctB family protein n=1 Tax=Stutzerimonas sp. VN223-3 TaxID=3384601 RepID=UPI0038B47455